MIISTYADYDLEQHLLALVPFPVLNPSRVALAVNFVFA